MAAVLSMTQQEQVMKLFELQFHFKNAGAMVGNTTHISKFWSILSFRSGVMNVQSMQTL